MDGFLTIKEVAEKWGLSTRRVQIMCSEGIIQGATKFGDVWAIPEKVERPPDGRVKSGKYRNWRRKNKDEKQ